MLDGSPLREINDDRCSVKRFSEVVGRTFQNVCNSFSETENVKLKWKVIDFYEKPE